MSRSPFQPFQPSLPDTSTHSRLPWPLRTLLAAAVAAATAWGALALWFQLPAAGALRVPPVAAWTLLGLACLGTLCLGRSARARRLWLAAFGAALLALLGWWHTIKPSHERVWADDVARLLEARVEGDRVVLRNVRNFDWRSETDYTPRWETREYDLSQLRSADLILSYWMGPAIAHTLVSFDFGAGGRVVLSLEIRKERHESFSAIGGFFRRFESVIIAADERDIVRTRSNARGEDVYLYRLAASPQALRQLFLGYMARAEALRRAPAFYNTLTSNCTTIVFDLARQIVPGLPLDYRLLLSGYFAEYAYDQGGLAPGFDYATLHALGHINARALQADAHPALPFSQAIRRGVPGIAPAEAGL